jgi:retinol dehydrogenase-12
MASYDSVKDFSKRISEELPRLDAVVANAGISTNEYHAAEGLESTLTVNVVSTFLMALLVLPKLEQTATQIGSPTHFTVTGSVVHCFAADQQLQEPSPGRVFKTLSDEGHADMAARYFLSKLVVIQCIRQLALRIPKRPGSKGPMVIVNCPNPGWCKTGLFRQDDGGFWGRNLLKAIGRTGEVGARTLTSAIAAGDNTHGQYLSECQVKPASAFVRSYQGRQVETKVWKELLELLDSVSPGVTDALAKTRVVKH